MKVDIKNKHMKTNILIKKIISSYVVTFLIIASFSLLILGANETVKGAKKLFTTSDSSDDSDVTNTVSVTPASSKANENSVVSTDITNPADENSVIATESTTPATSVANENSVIAPDSTNPADENSVVATDNDITDENSNEDDKDESNFWTWIANYDEDDDNLNPYDYDYSEESESNEKIGYSILSKLKYKSQNNKFFIIANYLILKFEKYFK